MKQRLLLAVLCFWTLSANAQFSFEYPQSSNYYLYSSEDRVYYNHNNKWEPVIYEETPLEDETMIKTNAPFTLVHSDRFFFCPEVIEPKKISDLVSGGGNRNRRNSKIVGMTASRGVALKVARLNRKTKFHALHLYKMDGGYTLMGLSDALYKTLKDTIDCLSGYNRILMRENEMSKDSVLASFKTLSDSISDSKYQHVILLYLFCNGNKDKEGKYHFMVSDSEFDSLTCSYKNTIPVDTIDTCIKELKSKGADIYIYINTNHPDDLARNIIHMDKSCYDLWRPFPFDKSYIKSLLRGMRDRSLYESYEYEYLTIYNIYYGR